jgi:hypothetical protein
LRREQNSFKNDKLSPYSIFLIILMAGGEGIEPSHTGPEPVVLPLDDPPTRINAKSIIQRYILNVKLKIVRIYRNPRKLSSKKAVISLRNILKSSRLFCSKIQITVSVKKGIKNKKSALLSALSTK